MPQTNPKVDAYHAKDPAWRAELDALRAILLDTELTEDLKWNKPCYTVAGGNVIATARLKDTCWLMFFKGALLNDHAGLLQKAGENSQSMRVLPLTSTAQIAELKDTLRAYITQAIANEKAGLKVEMTQSKNLTYPQELIDKFDADPDLRAAFEDLTPGRQRGYNLFFTGAKQSKTRTERIEKWTPAILAGKGMTDR